MDNEKVYAMPFGKVYPLLVSKAEKKGTNQRRSRPDHMLADGAIQPRQLSTRYTVRSIWRLFPQCTQVKSQQKANQGNRLRRARGGDFRAANAGNTVSR